VLVTVSAVLTKLGLGLDLESKRLGQELDKKPSQLEGQQQEWCS